MQLRVAGLIERCQDEIILESTLMMNDDLNTLFVRYDRWLKNCEAARGKKPSEENGKTSVETVGGVQVATTNLIEAVYLCAAALVCVCVCVCARHLEVYFSLLL